MTKFSGFSGIDPAALLGMIKSFTDDKRDLRQRVSGIKSQFGQHGLDTAPLSELLGICGWLDDQLPGLNRRLNLAAAMDHDHTKKAHFVQVPEPVITSAKARADGKALAEKFKNDTSGDPYRDFAAQLAAHADDPDYCSAFYANLPLDVATKLPSLITAAHDPDAGADLKIYSEAFGSAVSGAFPAPGFDKVEKAYLAPLPKDGGKEAYEDAANRLAMLHYGQFPVAFQGEVAKICLVDGSPHGEDGKEEEKENAWEKTEPYRKYLETFLAPFDIVAADHWIGALEKVAAQPSEWVASFGETVESIEAAKNAGQPITDALIQAAYEAENVGAKLDAWEAFSPGWLKAASGSLAEIRGLSTTLGALGIIADAGTIISPQDKGAMGWVDRGAAGVNGGLLVANMFLDEIPVVGEVTLVATGVYLAGDFLYHHFKPFHDVCDDVGHATVTAVKSVGHAASSAWHSVSSTVGSWF